MNTQNKQREKKHLTYTVGWAGVSVRLQVCWQSDSTKNYNNFCPLFDVTRHKYSNHRDF